MNISTKGRYGLRAMLDLASHYQDEKPVTLSSIAKRQRISEGYLEQLMMLLKKHHLVTSVRGAQGGYLLSRPPAEITAGDVYRSLEGPVILADCVVISDPLYGCNIINTCASRSLWCRLQSSIDEVLNAYTLADLLKDPKIDQ